MHGTIGIAGAGLLGRTLSIILHQQEWHVTLFDRDTTEGRNSCSFSSAGMLTPFAELDYAESIIAELGMQALRMWPKLLEQLGTPIFFQRNGTLILAHTKDHNELYRLQGQIQRKTSLINAVQHLQDLSHIQTLEPELDDRFHEALFLPEGAQLDNRQLLAALAGKIQQETIPWHRETDIIDIKPHTLITATNTLHFDHVIDCRGMGAKKQFPMLRGVRGELIHLSAPDLHLTHLIRLLHPRYPLYIVPRPNQHFIIGASSIESEDYSPISVQSTLELLSAAYTIHPSFSEARILETVANCRPALPDNLPKIYYQDGQLSINGLYRHGILLTPVIVDMVSSYINKKEVTNAAIMQMVEQNNSITQGA